VAPFLFGNSRDRARDAGIREVVDEVDAAGVEPFARR
jgi:hypothetical protein